MLFKPSFIETNMIALPELIVIDSSELQFVQFIAYRTHIRERGDRQSESVPAFPVCVLLLPLNPSSSCFSFAPKTMSQVTGFHCNP